MVVMRFSQEVGYAWVTRHTCYSSSPRRMVANDATTRVAVRARRAAATTGDSTQRVGCVVGGAGSRSVVWVRGGARADPPEEEDGACLRVPSDELLDLPHDLSEDVAVLCDDVAAAIATAKVVLGLRPDRVAVLTRANTRTIASFLVKYLRHNLHGTGESQSAQSRQPQMSTVVVTIDEINEASTTIESSAVEDHAALGLDCCVDLACNESSLAFATAKLQPLGSLVLLSHELPVEEKAEGAKKTIPIDMNAVVVNELFITFVRDDYTSEGPAALAFLTSAMHDGDTMQDDGFKRIVC